MTGTDVLVNFEKARVQVVEMLSQKGNQTVTVEGGWIHTFYLVPNTPLGIAVMVSQPASGITVNVVPPSIVTPPGTTTTPIAAPQAG